MRPTGHADTFAEERLPAAGAMPELLLRQLGYPQWLNAATELLDRRALSDGNRRCILTPSGDIWTYDRLFDASNRIAAVLVDDLGLKAGNRVLLRAPNTPMLAACWFGVLKAGGIAVTTMPLYRAAELRVMIDKARISHALCDARLQEELDSACAGKPDIRTIRFQEQESSPDSLERRMRAKSGRFENVRTAAEDVALIAFTSGTTGTPKAAMHYHRDILAICDTYCSRVLQPREDDLFAGSPPLGFTFGLGGLLLFPVHAGAATLLLEKSGPAELLEAVAKFRVTTIFTAPLAYRAMAAAWANYALGSLRSCVSAGETLPKAIWEEWLSKTGIKILDGIGSTEMLHIFVGSPAADARAGSTGRAVPGYIAEIHDGNGYPVENGVIGRLAVKGPTGCKYLDDPRQASYVQNGWNYPGDAYRMDDEGYFWYVARTDDMIVSAGYNIAGPEVEQALIAHADVKEVAVVGERDRQRETNYVKAFVVLVDGCPPTPEKAEELRDFCKSRIAPFKAPREVEFISALPRTESGKLQRYKLRGAATSKEGTAI
ncbi:MAG: AMP-binding protein [Candidatus Eremiobacteraeota bacterium]|nr:AMP-binding protein [Candidatus Eremiobacteraeota bacterium]